MFSALRKLTKKQDEKPVFPAGVAPVDQLMQKKYAKGVQYNMKLIVKGDRNTGKSTLVHRLTGGKFKEEYIPTQEIQVVNVNWNYKGADDIVKVEVWDIVDKSKKKRTLSGSLKISNEEVQDSPTEGLALDAELVDVYKGTHGVILMMDLTKAWTWQYVQRELEKIPLHIPVLVLANFRDMGDHRVVQTDEIIAFVEHMERPVGSAEVYFTEGSMKDGFGLRFIYKFINMPFLLLQRETLLRQLEANTLELEEIRESLCIDMLSEEHNYGLFKDMVAESLNPSVPENNPVLQSPTQQVKEELSPEPISTQLSPQLQPELQPVPPPTTVSSVTTTPKQVPIATVPPTIHTVEQPKQSKFQAYKAKLFGGDSKSKQDLPSPNLTSPSSQSDDSVPIDEFNPGQLDDDFLSGGGVPSKVNRLSSISKTSNLESDDEDIGNPIVAGYEDLESDDEHVFKQQVSVEADFDDLSDDERKKIEHSETSIIEQIKSSKHRKERKTSDNSLVNDIVVNTQSMDINEINDYDDVDTGPVDQINTAAKNILNDRTIDEPMTQTNDLNENLPNTSEILSNEKYSSKIISLPQESLNESESDEDEQPFIITGDVDVDDGWLEHEVDNDDEPTAEDEEDNDNEVEEDTSSKCKSDVAHDSSVNFDLDDLEMFMNNQLQKPTAEVSQTIEEAPKPRKKKKKKVITSEPSEETEAINEKKKKKKKVRTEIVETGDNHTTSTKPKKTRKSEDGTSTSKKKKKSARKPATPEKSEYDAFFDDL